MDRLTTKWNGSIELKDAFNVSCKDVCEANVCDLCPIQNALNKLSEYEDLEEHGFLMKLPCNVGDTVYMLRYILDCDYDYDRKECDACKCETFEYCEHEHKVYIIAETEFQIKMLATLGKTVFLTREEAEKALVEMEGGMNDGNKNKPKKY